MKTQQLQGVLTHRTWLVAVTAAVVLSIGAGAASAAAAPYLRINGRLVSGSEPVPTMVNGQVMWAVRPLFKELGGSVQSVDRDTVRIQRSGRTLDITNDQREYRLDGRRQNFSVATFTRLGQVYVPVQDIIRLFGGSYRYDQNTLTATVSIASDSYRGGSYPDYGYPGSPSGDNAVVLYTPREGDVVGTGNILVQGIAPPGRDVRIIVATSQRTLIIQRFSREVYKTVTRTDRNGRFSLRVRLDDENKYRITAELLGYNDRVDARRQVTFEARRGYAGGYYPGSYPSFPQDKAFVTIDFPSSGARLTSGDFPVKGRTVARGLIEVELYKANGNQRVANGRVSADDRGHWLLNFNLNRGNLVGNGPYRIVASLLNRDRNQRLAQQQTAITLSLSNDRGNRDDRGRNDDNYDYRRK